MVILHKLFFSCGEVTFDDVCSMDVVTSALTWSIELPAVAWHLGTSFLLCRPCCFSYRYMVSGVGSDPHAKSTGRFMPETSSEERQWRIFKFHPLTFSSSPMAQRHQTGELGLLPGAPSSDAVGSYRKRSKQSVSYFHSGLGRRREEDCARVKAIRRLLYTQREHHLRTFSILYSRSARVWNGWSIHDGITPNCRELWFWITHTRAASPWSFSNWYQEWQGTWKFA